MILSSLIRKHQPADFATATVTTFAKALPKTQLCVAPVAGVAVANTGKAKIEINQSWSQWLFHFADRDDLPVMFAPPVDRTEALSHYPDSISAVPQTLFSLRKPTQAEVDEIRALVQTIYANDSKMDQAEALAVAMGDPYGALLCYRETAKPP
jgi:Holliday junction resolvasome RuvABC endonuclease subunit